ncbi:MAG: group III truncated hemoglobin [Proteobacteria bacterium]|nr:group III truncated hemoglobin [Pseudomonadota bacterium]
MTQHLTPEEHAARRARITADLREKTGIDETMIERLVRAFYGKVQADPALGPVFAARISDWEPHLERMFAFWSSVTLMTGIYHGRPMQKHFGLPVEAAHFDRWLALFRETARETCPPVAAAVFIEKAEMIAQSIEFGMATMAGIRLAPGERFANPALGQA